MRGVFLDQKTLNQDLDWNKFEALLPEWVFYDNTKEKDILARLESAEIAITNKVPFTKDTLEKAKSLKLICVAATGVDRIDLETAKALGIKVCNVPSYSTPSVIQHTFSLILGLFTQLLSYTQDVKNGLWSTQDLFCLKDYPILELSGKTLGIIGYGAIGKQIAKVAHAFGMHVLVADIQQKGTSDRLPLDRLLPQVDVLSIHCPLTENTRHLISDKELAMMKPTAFVINTARGAIIDETALARALDNKVIAGAGLDVLSEEPPKATHPLVAYKGANLLLTPHVAWASFESQTRLLESLSRSITAFRQNQEPLPNQVV